VSYSSSGETFSEDFITCPNCGWEDRDSWEHMDSGDITCDKCDSLMHFERQTMIHYDTKLIPRITPPTERPTQ
jgi:RNase P subunit RPR2